RAPAGGGRVPRPRRLEGPGRRAGARLRRTAPAALGRAAAPPRRGARGPAARRAGPRRRPGGPAPRPAPLRLRPGPRAPRGGGGRIAPPLPEASGRPRVKSAAPKPTPEHQGDTQMDELEPRPAAADRY